MGKMSWDEFFQKRCYFAGRDIETEHDSKIYRGPITHIWKTIDLESVWAGDVAGYQIWTRWIAVREKGGTDWKLTKSISGQYCALPLKKGKLSDLERRDDGSFVFTHSKLGVFVILPPGDHIEAN